MYTPRHFAMPAELQQRILAAPGVGDLVTSGPDGLMATHLPYVFDPAMGETLGGITGASSAILLGRRTYAMFAPAWSTRTVEDDPGERESRVG